MPFTIFGDQGIYKGRIVGGLPNGRGAFRWTGGERAGRTYEGDFKDGKLEGQGTNTWPSGQKYEGDFKDGKREGQGTQTWPDGSVRYRGLWKDDKRENQGGCTVS